MVLPEVRLSSQMADQAMSQKRHKLEKIVAKLRQVDVLESLGRSITDAVRAIGVTQFTYYARTSRAHAFITVPKAERSPYTRARAVRPIRQAVVHAQELHRSSRRQLTYPF